MRGEMQHLTAIAGAERHGSIRAHVSSRQRVGAGNVSRLIFGAENTRIQNGSELWVEWRLMNQYYDQHNSGF
jgi:hypothetical protein